MAFTCKIGNILKRTVSNHIKSDLSASSPSMYQAIRCMSSSKLFVGGLSYSTDDQSLREAFTGYGEVIEARVIMDRETGRSRGFGFVSFTSGEEASAAITGMDGKDLHGRMVRVNYATERTGGFRGGGYGGGGGDYGGGGGYGGGSGGYGGGSYGGGGGNYGGDSYGSGGGGYGGGTGGYGGDSYGSGGGSYGGSSSSYGSGGGGYGGNSGGGNYGVAGGGGGSDGYVSAANFGAADSGSSYGGSRGMGYGSSQGSMNAGGDYNQGNPIEGNYRDEDDDEPDDYTDKRV
ncbi:glycine-rich RNA-binding protein blt801-like isoform X2 [Magnolia sinica]|uniref:glycine-rich RNA-binding protein blt801-like isoform X2 n=1 Tax=Magnolia sinica TaxID=86752 RepID=UPI00265A0CEB|nr:glycine-rich RNA-binding protein blt801-like isoform X2 [Magnolia sinica]